MGNMIEVGEYVRVTNYENKTAIGKVAKVFEESYLVDTGKEDTSGEYGKCCEFKHSKQLIDLIEVEDIVNGYRVINVINKEPCPSGKCVDIDSSKDSSECTLWENDIETILTKESYMANCYKVGGEEC